MALGIIGAYGGLIKKELKEYVLVGELSLDGGIRGVRGALPIAVATRNRKILNLIVPEANAREAAVVAGVNVYPVKSLMEVVHFLNHSNGIAPLASDPAAVLQQAQHFTVDFKDVRGQQTAQRALEVACAQWRALPRRAAGVSAQRSRGHAPAAGRWQRLHCAGIHVADFSSPLHAGGGDESVSLRIF